MRLNRLEQILLAVLGRAAVIYIGRTATESVCGVQSFRRRSSHQVPVLVLPRARHWQITALAEDLRDATGLRIHVDASAREIYGEEG